MRAKELIFTKRVLTAEEARDWGLANRVVAPDDLTHDAVSVARNFADGPSRAFGRLKRLIQTTNSDPMYAQLEMETQAISWTITTRDGPHGIDPFLEKKKPEFKGR